MATPTLGEYANRLLGAGERDDDDDPAGGPHAHQHRQWWETHTAIIVLLLVGILFGAAAVGTSAGFGQSILNKLHDCCGDIKEQLTEISEQIAACCDMLGEAINALSVLLTSYYNSIVDYFVVVIDNEETIIELLESPPAWTWKCATGYALPAPNCINLTQAMLPLTVPIMASGACYVLQSDLVWNSTVTAAYAIDWNGGGGALYGCGHKLSTTSPVTRMLRVRGNGSAVSMYGSVGELDVFDMKFQGPDDFYNTNNRGPFAFRGGRLRLYNVKTHNLAVGSIAISAVLEERNCNHTVEVDVSSVYRLSSYLAGTYFGQITGSRCQSSNCRYIETDSSYTMKLLPNGTVDYSIIPFYDYMTGFWGDYNPNGLTFDQGQPTVMHVERCNSYGTDPFFFNRVGRGFILDSTAKIAVAPPPSTPAFPNNGQDSFGVRLGCGRPTNIVVDGLVLDASEIGDWSGIARALWLVGTQGLILNNVNVFGKVPMTQRMYDIYPTHGQIGLITAEQLIDTYGMEPLQFNNLNVYTNDPETVGMVIYSQADTITHGPDCYGTRGSIMLNKAFFVGGLAGISVGSQQRHLLTVRDSAFQGQYYGIYAFNESSNIVVRDTDFARTCEAVHIQATVANVILRSNNFVGNNFDLVDDSAAVVEFGSLNAGTVYVPCANPPSPYLWDKSLLVPCSIIASAPSVPSRDFPDIVDE